MKIVADSNHIRMLWWFIILGSVLIRTAFFFVGFFNIFAVVFSLMLMVTGLFLMLYSALELYYIKTQKRKR